MELKWNVVVGKKKSFSSAFCAHGLSLWDIPCSLMSSEVIVSIHGPLFVKTMLWPQTVLCLSTSSLLGSSGNMATRLTLWALFSHPHGAWRQYLWLIFSGEDCEIKPAAQCEQWECSVNHSKYWGANPVLKGACPEHILASWLSSCYFYWSVKLAVNYLCIL